LLNFYTDIASSGGQLQMSPWVEGWTALIETYM